MSGFAVEPGRRTIPEWLCAAKSPVWHARPARMPYSQEAAEHDLGFRFSLFRETRPKFVEMCQTDVFAAHRQAKPCGGGRAVPEKRPETARSLSWAPFCVHTS